MKAWRRALGARFDTAALRPFDEREAAAGAAFDWPALRAWLDQPAQAGTAPRAPSCHPRLAVAACASADRIAAFRAAAGLGLWLDGTQALQACRGPAGRVTLRLRVKLQDTASMLTQRPHGIWDCGYVPDEPAAWRALAAFAPRRASFIVVCGPDARHPVRGAPVVHAVHALMERQARLACPVRLLVLGPSIPDLQAVNLPGPRER